MARVEWLPGRALVRDVTWGADDAMVLAEVAEADKVGIDCPLGCPDIFVVAHQVGPVTVPRRIEDRGWRRSLTCA